MRKLRLGIIGTGIATNDLYWPELQKLRSSIEIVAVANRRKAKAVTFAKRAKVKVVCESGEELLARPDIEAVVLSLPIHLNATWVIKALKAGKHVICEKPLAANVAEGKRLVTAAAKYKKLWLVAENYYFAPHIVAARNWLKAGKVGKAQLIEAAQCNRLQASNKYFQTSWRQDPRFIGGFVVDAGVHIADIVREMLGMPVKVTNLTARFNPIVKPIDTAIATMRFKGGVLGLWKSCFSATVPAEIPMVRLFGSKGTIEVFYSYSVLTPQGGKPQRADSKLNGIYFEFKHFAEAVVLKKKLAFTPKQALADLALMQAIVK